MIVDACAYKASSVTRSARVLSLHELCSRALVACALFACSPCICSARVLSSHALIQVLSSRALFPRALLACARFTRALMHLRVYIYHTYACCGFLTHLHSPKQAQICKTHLALLLHKSHAHWYTTVWITRDIPLYEINGLPRIPLYNLQHTNIHSPANRNETTYNTYYTRTSKQQCSETTYNTHLQANSS